MSIYGWQLLGENYQNKEDLEKAIEAYISALKIDSKDHDIQDELLRNIYTILLCYNKIV